MSKINELKAQIKAIQDACDHLPEYIEIKYSEQYYDDYICGNAWADYYTYTHFHCHDCDKKWQVDKKVTKEQYKKNFDNDR